MNRYLVLDVGCAECRSDRPETVVHVLGHGETLKDAQAIAKPHIDKHTWVDGWEQCDDGWFAAAGDGELRIIDLGTYSLRTGEAPTP